MESGFKVGGVFEVQCFGPDGKLKWKDTAKNLVTNEGLDHILDVVLGAEAKEATWYVGLTDGTPTLDATDVLSSHTGWIEVTDYTGDRQEFVDAAASGQSITNSASKASFAIDATVTVGGAFLCAAATLTTATLLCVAAFTGGDKAADSGDTLEVSYSISAADA